MRIHEDKIYLHCYKLLNKLINRKEKKLFLAIEFQLITVEIMMVKMSPFSNTIIIV